MSWLIRMLVPLTMTHVLVPCYWGNITKPTLVRVHTVPIIQLKNSIQKPIFWYQRENYDGFLKMLKTKLSKLRMNMVIHLRGKPQHMVNPQALNQYLKQTLIKVNNNKSLKHLPSRQIWPKFSKYYQMRPLMH